MAAELGSSGSSAPLTARAARTAPAYTALVVDDNPASRAATAQRLRALGADDVVEATGLAQARAYARLSGPRDIAVLDLRLPDGSGLELLVDLRALGWEHLVVLSDVDDLAAVRAAFLAGAQGYLLSSAPDAIVVSGLRRVLEGGLYADPAVACPPPTRTAPGGGTAHELSGREVEVLQLVADGHTNKQIGTGLGLSALTVKSHLARMGRKLGTGDRAEMVAHGMRAGVIH